MLELLDPPIDPNATLWRYLDLFKLVSLLETKALRFASTEHFVDKYEGRPLRGIFGVPRNDEEAEEVSRSAAQLTDEIARSYRVNSWNMGETESESLWDQYAPTGVVVKTSVTGLCAAIGNTPLNLFGRQVQYGDHSMVEPARMTPFWQMLSVLTFKRPTLLHESEFRLIGISSELDGGLVPVDLERLIAQVIVYPLAPAWHVEVVRQLVSSTLPKTSVRGSTIRDDPPPFGQPPPHPSS